MAAGVLAVRRSRCRAAVCEVGPAAWSSATATRVLDLGVAVVTTSRSPPGTAGTPPRDRPREGGDHQAGHVAVNGASEPGLGDDPVTRSIGWGDPDGCGRAPSSRDGQPGWAGRGRQGVRWAPSLFEHRCAAPFSSGHCHRGRGWRRALGDRRSPSTRRGRRGCEDVRWPGRMDWIHAEPPLLIDGAHNLAGMAAMVASARELIGARRCPRRLRRDTRNKDVSAMADAFPSYPGDPRSPPGPSSGQHGPPTWRSSSIRRPTSPATSGRPSSARAGCRTGWRGCGVRLALTSPARSSTSYAAEELRQRGRRAA